MEGEVALMIIPELGGELCIGILVLVLIVLVVGYIFSLLIHFLPAALSGILIYLLTADVYWALIAFFGVALLMTLRKGK